MKLLRANKGKTENWEQQMQQAGRQQVESGVNEFNILNHAACNGMAGRIDAPTFHASVLSPFSQQATLVLK